MSAPDRRTISAAEACRQLGISRTLLDRLLEERRIGYLNQKPVRLRQSHVDDYLSRYEVKPVSHA